MPPCVIRDGRLTLPRWTDQGERKGFDVVIELPTRRSLRTSKRSAAPLCRSVQRINRRVADPWLGIALNEVVTSTRLWCAAYEPAASRRVCTRRAWPNDPGDASEHAEDRSERQGSTVGRASMFSLWVGSTVALAPNRRQGERKPAQSSAGHADKHQAGHSRLREPPCEVSPKAPS